MLEVIENNCYIKYKKYICDEQDLYDNSAATTTLFRARTVPRDTET